MDTFTSLHHTLLTLPPHRVHWTWLCLDPVLAPGPGLLSHWPCLLPLAMVLLMPLLSSSFCFMDHGGLGRGPCLLPTIHTLCQTH